MPIYEYYCQDCNTKFELIRDIAKANDPAKCQKCGSNNTKRLISKFYSQGSSENSSSLMYRNRAKWERGFHLLHCTVNRRIRQALRGEVV